jgi:hypothetical protein
LDEETEDKLLTLIQTQMNLHFIQSTLKKFFVSGMGLGKFGIDVDGEGKKIEKEEQDDFLSDELSDNQEQDGEDQLEEQDQKKDADDPNVQKKEK